MANTFVDTTGTMWAITINVATLERVKNMSDVDLGYIQGKDMKVLATMKELNQDDQDEGLDDMLDMMVRFSDTMLGRLTMDPILLGNVLYAIVAKQVEERNMTRDQFVELLDAETLDRASTVFWAEYSAFFQKNRQNVFHQLVEACLLIRRSFGAEIVSEASEPALTAASPNRKKQPTSPSEPKTETSGQRLTTRPELSESILAPSP